MKPIITFTAVRVGDVVAKSRLLDPKRGYTVVHKSDSQRWCSVRSNMKVTAPLERMSEAVFNANEFVLIQEGK